MRILSIVLLLLCMPAVFAALDVQVQLEAPESLLPGEAANISVSATLNGVTILSFPANATMRLPDGTIIPVTLENTFQGDYRGIIYSVAEGQHTITATVNLDGEEFTAQQFVRIEKPKAAIEIQAGIKDGVISGTIEQDIPSDYTLELAPFGTGDLASKKYTQACTFTCGSSCSFSCPAPSGAHIAKFTTRKAYTYSQYIPVSQEQTNISVTYDPVTGVDEPEVITLSRPAEAYTLFGTILNQVPIINGNYLFTPQAEDTGSIIIKDNDALAVYPVEVITRDNVQLFQPLTASDDAYSWWYGFVSAEKETLLKLPAEPGMREAYRLSNGIRQPLSWEKSYVVVPAGSGWVEVKRAQPPTDSRTLSATEYGALAGGQHVQRHEIPGKIQVFDTLLASVATYTNGSTSVFYTQDQSAAVIYNTRGEVSVTQPLKSGDEGTITYNLEGSQQDTAVSLYSYEGLLMQKMIFSGSSGSRDLLFSLAPGKYLAVASGDTNAAAAFVIYSDQPSITISPEQELQSQQNQEVTITHSITNNDLLNTQTVDISAESKFTVLINATDSNSNGIVDLVIGPGETAAFTATVFIGPGASSGPVTFTANASELTDSVTDSIQVEMVSIPTYTDADITEIQGSASQPVVHIQNNDQRQLIGTLYISGQELTTQLSVTLQPGMNKITVPAVGTKVTARLQIIGDVLPENNERTRDFKSPQSTRLVHINERVHTDHTQYTIQLPTIPGYTLVWEEDGIQKSAVAMQQGATTLWSLGALPANQEFYAALVEGTPQEGNFSILIDNSNPAVAKKGTWVSSLSTPGYIGFDFLIDLNLDKTAAVIYAPKLSHNLYTVRMYTPADPSFADNVPVSIDAKYPVTVSVNQRKGGWQYLGLYELYPNSSIAIENRKTTQFVVADAVEFTPISQIGSLERIGNSSLELTAKVSAPVRVSTLAYLDGVASVTAPANVTVAYDANTITLIAQREGTYTILVKDEARTLTITLTANKPVFDYPVNATIQTAYGPVKGVIYTDRSLAPLTNDLNALGAAAEWVFDAKVTVLGKEFTLTNVYMPNYTLPITVVPSGEDKSGKMFIFDAYTVHTNGLRADDISIDDVAQGTVLTVCSSQKKNGKCDWTPVQAITPTQYYTVKIRAADTTIAEAHALQAHTKKPAKKDRSYTWEKVENGNKGTLQLFTTPKFFKQDDGFADINTTIVLGDGTNDLESPGASVQVKDNIYKATMQLQTGKNMISLVNDYGTATISMPQQGVKGKVLNNKITYAAIAPNTDLEFEVEAGMLKEMYVLYNSNAPRTFTSSVTLPNTVLEETPETYVFRDRSTQQISWVMWKPFAYDELGKQDTPGHRTPLETTITQEGDVYTISATLSDAWLTANDRVYPVYVDPTMVTGSLNSNNGGYLRNNEPAFPDDDLAVGEFGSDGQFANGFIRFAFSGSIPNTAVITEANFSVGVQENTGWDAGDWIHFSILNSTPATAFWSDAFKTQAEYHQENLTNLYPFFRTDDRTVGTRYSYVVNSTGLTGLQQVLVKDQQTYVTVRTSFDSTQLTDHQTNNEYVTYFTGINCCAVTGTIQSPQLNVTYVFESDTPVLTSPGFNQTTYNTSQTVKFSVNITDVTSGLDQAAVYLKNPSATLTNYTLNPSQAAATVSTTVSSVTQTLTSANRTYYLFYDDFSFTNGTFPSPYLWQESGSNDWDIIVGRGHSDNAGGTASVDYLTPLMTTSLAYMDGGTLTFDYETNGIEAPDCLEMHLFNASSASWITAMTRCIDLAIGSWQENVSSASYKNESFSFRVANSGNANNDEVYVDNVNLTAWRADNQNNTDYVQYDDVTASTLRNISSLLVSVSVTGYDPRGSVSRGNTKPDLSLEFYNGSAWISAGSFNLATTYTGSGYNNTARTFSASTSDSTVLSAWADSKYKRDFRIRATNVDWVSASTIDQINYTSVVVNSTQTGGDVMEKTWSGASLVTLGMYNATEVFANDTMDNRVVTTYNTHTFTLYSFASVSSRATPGGLSAYPDNVNFTCTVVDSMIGTPIANYNVTMTSNVSGNLGTYNTNSSGQASVVLSVTDISSLTCTIGNRLDMYYYANVSSDSKTVAVDVTAPSWSNWSLGVVDGNNMSDGISVNRTNSTLQVRSYWIDDIGIDVGYIEHNGTGTLDNYTNIGFGGGTTAQWNNYTFDFSDGTEFSRVGLINVTRAWVADFVPNWNYTTPSKYFYLYGTVNLTSISLSNSNPAIFESVVATCELMDLYNIPAVGYTVNFYRDSTSLGSAVTDTAGDASVTFNTSSVGVYTITCNITDNPSDYYYVSTSTTNSTSLSVTPDVTAPNFRALNTTPTSVTLGNNTTLQANINDSAGIFTARFNVTLPTGTITSIGMNGSGSSYSALYNTSVEGLHELVADATDPSNNRGASPYTHFIVGGKAAINMRTFANRYNSNSDVDLNQSTILATADLEAGTQAFSATVTSSTLTGIEPYFSNTGTCAGTTRAGAPAANSCRRAGYVSNNAGKKWGGPAMYQGYNGSTTTANEMMTAWMFNLSGLPDTAALTSGYVRVTVINDNGWRNVNDMNMYAIASNSIWDSNGPERDQLQALASEFTVGTLTGAQLRSPGTKVLALTQTQLDLIEGHLATDGLTMTLRPTGASSSEYVWFETGFGSSSTALDPELAVNYTSPTIDYNGTQVNYTTVIPTNQPAVAAIRINITISGTDFRGSNGSFAVGLGRMPILRVNIYNGTAYKQKYACDILQRGISGNTTVQTCSITVRDSEFLTAWQTAANRNVQVQAMNLDTRNEGTDSINWTGVFVEMFNGSVLINTGPQTLGGNLELTVERNISNTFTYNATIYNASQTLASGQIVNLASLWNASAWDTGDRAEGTYRAVARLLNSSGTVDPQGDGNSIQASYNFTINDTVGPLGYNQYPANNSTVYGLNTSGVNFTFYATDATGFTNCSLYLNSTLTNTTTSVTSGQNTTLYAYNIAEGAYLWHVRCYDNASALNFGNSSNWTIRVDNGAPYVNITSTNLTNFSSTTVIINFTITDNLSTNMTFRAFANGTLFGSGNATNNTVTNFTFTSLNEGRQNITIEGRDVSGLAYNATIVIIVDLTPPYTTINTVSNTYYNSTTPLINFTSLDNLSTTINYTIYVNSTANVTGQTTNNTLTGVNLVQVPEGNHSVTVQGTDMAGNKANSSSIRIIVDLTAPTVTLNSPAEGYSTTATGVMFNWTAVDSLSASFNCSLIIDGATNTTASTSNNTATTTTVLSITEGSHNWTVACRDLANNNATASQTRNFSVDRTNASILLNRPLNRTHFNTTTVNVNWTAIDAIDTSLTCSIYIDGSLNASGIASANNTPTNRTIIGFTDAWHSWNISCTDDATNTNSSLVNRFLIDTTFPTIDYVSPTPANNSSQNTTSFRVNLTSTDANTQYVLNDFNRSVVLWMRMDDINSSGDPQDSSTYNNHGTIANSPLYTESGYWGEAFNFTDNTEQIRVAASTSLDLQSTFTISAWIRPRNSGLADYQTIVNKEDSIDASTDRNFWLDLWTTGVLNMRFSSTSSDTDCDVLDDTDLRDNSWHHVIGIYNGTHCSLYLDGVFQLSDATAAAPEGIGDPVYIGYESGIVGRGFDGLIDEVIILNRALSQAEISSLYNATATQYDNNFSALADGVYNTTGYVVDAAGNKNATQVRFVTVDATPPVVSLVSPSDATTLVLTRDVNLTYNVSDTTSSISTCQLYVNGSASTLVTAITENVNHQFNLTDLNNGNYSWQVRCNDTAGNIGSSALRLFNINITVNAQSPVNDTVIDRDSISTDPDVLTLVANITDSRNGATITFKANLTSPSIIPSQVNIILGSNSTNSTGHATLVIDANSTLYAGNYTWWAEESRSLSNSSKSLNVYGNASSTYNSSTLYPNTEYNVSQVASFVYSVVTPGPENASALNASYNVKVSVNLTQPNGTITQITAAAYNGSTWNTSYSIPSAAEIGVWNVSALTNGTWFYNTSVATRNFTVKGAANAVSPANGTTVDRDSADATDPDTIQLIVQLVGATQTYTVNFTANLTNPVLGGQSNLVLGSNTTNSTGYAVLYFNPNSTTYAGNYTWFGVSTVSFTNQTASFIVKGGLNSTYKNNSYNPNSTYFINDTVLIDANVSSLAVESRDELNSTYGITVNSTLQNTSSSLNTASTVYAGNYWNASHSILTLKGVGVWNSTVNTSGTYFYLNNTSRTFTVYSYMNVTSNSTTPSTVYAYQYTTTTCGVNDQYTNYAVQNANVSFYRNGTYLGNNTSSTAGIASYSFQTNVTGTYIITCNVTNQPGIYYYRGDEPERNSTLTIIPYAVDTISPSNGSIVDRDSVSADPDFLLLNVSVPSYVPDGVLVDFRANITNPALGITDQLLGSNTTNGSYAVLYYNPASTVYAGNWTWYANTSSGAPNNVSNFIVKGGLNSSYNSTSNPDSTYFQNSTATIIANVTSLGPETRAELNSTYTITVNNTLQNISGGTSTAALTFNNPAWSTTQTILSLAGVGVWNTSVNTSGNYFYLNNTSRTFTVYGYMNITANTTTPSSIIAFQYTTTSCTVLDHHTSVPVSNANVTFYRNGTFIGNNTTSAAGVASLSYQTTTVGQYSVTCNLTDQPSILYYRGDEPERNSTLTVTPYPIDAVNPANNTIVDRDSADVTDNDIILLNVSVPSYVSDNTLIDFRSNITSPALGITDQLLGSNNTSNGYAVLYYNPTSTTYAGNWTWYANSSAGYSNTTRTYISRGALNISYNSSANPNSTYFQNDTTVIVVNATSIGPETRDELSTSYGITVNNTLQNTTSGTTTAALAYNSPFWNSTQSILTLKGVGVWNTTALAASSYFYLNTTNRSFTVYGYMNVTTNTTTPSSIFAFQYTTTSCTLRDQHSDAYVANANVTFYRDGTYLGVNATNAAGVASYSFQTNTSGTYAVTCNVSNQPSIYYYAGDEKERSSTLIVRQFEINATSPANDTAVDRDGISASDPDVLTLNITVPSYIPDGELIDFRANLTDPAIGGQTGLLLGSNNTSSGTVIMYFNPASTMYVGNYTWYGNHSAGVANATKTFTVKGGLNTNYNSSVNPNSTYFQNQTVVTQANVSSFGVETRDELNSTYTITVTSSNQNTSGSIDTQAMTYQNPYWSVSHSILTLKGVGVWNTSVNSSGQYWYNNTTNRTFTVYGYMNITSNTTSPSSVYVFQWTTSSCAVLDQHTSYPVVNAQVSFYRNGTYLGNNTTDGSGAASYSFQTNASGTYTVTCNVSSQPGIYYYAGDEPERNSTLTVNPFPIDASGPANNSVVDRQSASATDPDYLLLNITIPSLVPDGILIDFRANITSPTSGLTNVFLGSNNSSGGTVLLYFDPANTLYAGNWTWFGNHSSGYANSTRTFINKGLLEVAYNNNTYNPNSTYFQNSTIVADVNATTQGVESRDELNSSYTISVNNTVQNTSSSTNTTNLVYASQFWSGSHTILTLKGVGAWNTTANASGTYWYGNSTNRTFTVYGYMNITANTTTPSSIIAFQYSTTTCTVLDQHTNYAVAGATVSFYRNGTYLGNNTSNTAGTASYSFQTNVTGTYITSCNLTDQPSIYYYRGDAPEGNSTLTVTPYPIDAVNPANDSIVDRDSANALDADVLLLNVSVPSYVPDNTLIDFRSNISSPALGITGQLLGSNNTSSGYAVLYYNPTSTTYAGNWTWYANSSAGYPNTTRTYVSKGALNSTYTNNTYNPNSTYRQNETVIIEANVTSIGPETRAELNSSYTITVNSTLQNTTTAISTLATSFTNPHWNASHSILTLAGVGVWNSTVNTSGNYFYLNNTSRTFTVYGYMNITTNVTNPITVTTYQYATTSCTVRDQHTNAYVPNANVTFYRNGTLVGNNTTNAAGVASLTYQTNISGVYTVICNVTDQPNIYYYRGDEPERNSTLTVTPFAIGAQSPANGTHVDRDGTNASTSDVLVLNLTVPSYVPDGELIDFRANLTDPAVGGQTNILLGSNTTSGGIITMYYDPASTVYAGNYTWYGNHSQGYSNETKNFIVYGSVNITFANSTLDPNNNYTKPVSVFVGANFTSYGFESNTIINSSYNPVLNVTITKISGSTVPLTLTYNGTAWSNSYALATSEPRGTWDAKLNGSIQYMYIINTTNRTFVVNNIAPTQATPVLNASDNPLNRTNTTLTAYNQSTVDAESDNVTNVYVWRVNGSDYALVQLPFDTNVSSNASNAVKDYAGMDNNGTLGGGTASAAPTWNDSGKVGGAYTFDGGDYITIADRAPMSEVTVMAWIYVNDFSNGLGSQDYFIHKDNEYSIGFVDLGSGKNPLYSAANSGNVLISDFYNNEDEWIHVVLTYSDSNNRRRLYLNGGLFDTSATAASMPNGPNPTYIGAVNSTANFVQGTIDDVRIYNKELSPDQIYRIYSEGLNRTNTSTIVANETRVNDVWSVCVTPNDNADDGTTLCSNTVQITGIVNATSPANNSIVDRDQVGSDADNITLVTDAFGDGGVTITYYANLTTPVIAGQTDLILGSAVTNSTGYATLVFNPNSTFYAGNYTWWGTMTNGSSVGSRAFSIYGGLNVTSWNDSDYPSANETQNSTLTTRYNLSSFGPESRDQLNSSYLAKLTSNVNNTTSSVNSANASYTSPYWNASHSLLLLKGVGVWNASANVSASYFYTNQTQRNFTVFGYMNITSNTTTPSTISTYQNTTTSCTVLDQHTNYAVAGATVSFYRNGTYLGNNTSNTAGIAAYTFQTNNSGTYVVTCNLTNQPSIYYYAGDETERNSTLIVNPFKIDTISPVNGTLLDRDGVSAVDADSTILNVTVESFVPDGVTIEFRANQTDPSLGSLNVLLGTNTTVGSRAVLYFNPNSSTYAGNWTWYGNNPGAVVNSTLYFINKGSLNVTFRNNTFQPNASYNETETIDIEANVTSTETRIELNSTYSGSVMAIITNPSNSNATRVLSFTDPYWNGSFNLLTLTGVGIWNVNVTANATYFYTNSTNRTLNVSSQANITNISLTPSTQYAYQNSTAACKVINAVTGGAIQNYNVTFQRNGTLVGTAITDVNGNANVSFQTNISGIYNVNCTITDDNTLFYFALDYEDNATLTVNKYALTPQSPANDTVLDRDSYSVLDADVAALNVSVPSEIPNGLLVDFRANITDPVIGGQTNILLGSNATNNGYITLYYNPANTVYAGNYTWYTNESQGEANGTLGYIVKGSYSANYTSNTTNPNSTYRQNESITVEANITSAGPETRNDLNASYNTQINTTHQNSTSGSTVLGLLYNGSIWRNNTFNILSLAGVGVWNNTVNSSIMYFYDAPGSNTSYTVYGYMNITNLTINPDPVDAYNSVDLSCRVQDQHTNAYVANANVTFYQNNTYIGSNLTNSTGEAKIRYAEVNQGIFNVTCNITTDLSIYYYTGDEPNMTATINVTPILLTPFAPVNGTQVDRDNSSYGSETITLVVKTLPGVPDGIMIDFYVNLTDPALGGQDNILIGSNITNGTYINLTFNPNSSMYAGSYVWWTDASGGQPNGSATFNTMGTVNITYNSSTGNPRAEYNETDTAYFDMNASSLGPETITQLNSTYNGIINLTLVTPANGTVERNSTYNGSAWNASYYLFGYGVGEWNTSAIFHAPYFFPVNITLRNFSTIGYINIDAYDNEEAYSNITYANSIAYIFANVTNSFNEPLLGATCNAVFSDRTLSLTYNATTELYENQTIFSVEAFVPYNITCSKAFYVTNSDVDNITMHSLANVTLSTNITEVSAGVQEITFMVRNNQNYTEHDVWVYTLIPQNFTISYNNTSFDSQYVEGAAFVGNSTRWYIPNITAGSASVIRYTATGYNNLTGLYQAALKVYTTNTTVIY
jgi:hypothetical protein